MTASAVGVLRAEPPSRFPGQLRNRASGRSLCGVVRRHPATAEILIPELQHYVPQCLLRNWRGGAKHQVNVYDKHADKAFKAAVSKVAAVNGYYNAPSLPGVNVEAALGMLETAAAAHISKILSEHTVATLSQHERVEVSVFCAAQMDALSGELVPAPLQWFTATTIAAAPDRVWAIVDDITLIPTYHPEVRQVDLLSGTRTRAAGVRYRCTIPEGRRGSCVEEVIEYEPGRRFVTAFPEDSWGLSKHLAEFTVEALVEPAAGGARVTLTAYYRPRSLLMKVLNPLGLRRLMARRASFVIAGIKRLAEGPPLKSIAV